MSTLIVWNYRQYKAIQINYTVVIIIGLPLKDAVPQTKSSNNIIEITTVKKPSSCGIHSNSWLPLDAQAKIFSSRPAVDLDLTREPSKLEAGAFPSWKTDDQVLVLVLDFRLLDPRFRFSIQDFKLDSVLSVFSYRTVDKTF